MSGAEESIEATMMELVGQRGPGKTICPSEVARALAGPDPQAWSKLMPAIRRTAVRLMADGRVLIRRKGKVVPDPDDFRGIYRIGPPGQGAADQDEAEQR